MAISGVHEVVLFDRCVAEYDAPSTGQFDAVIEADVLERCPGEGID